MQKGDKRASVEEASAIGGPTVAGHFALTLLLVKPENHGVMYMCYVRNQMRDAQEHNWCIRIPTHGSHNSVPIVVRELLPGFDVSPRKPQQAQVPRRHLDNAGVHRRHAAVILCARHVNMRVGASTNCAHSC